MQFSELNPATRFFLGTGRQLSRLSPALGLLARRVAVHYGGRCAFVVSTGRVGTLTLTNVLGLSPDVVAAHEPGPVLLQESYDAYMDETDIAQSKRWRDLVFKARSGPVIKANLRGKIYVETNNRLTYLARAIARAFPASQFIHLHRHPYEVIRSGMRRAWYQGHPWDFARIRPKQQEMAENDWKALSPEEKIAWNWSFVNLEIMNFFELLPPWRKLTLPSVALLCMSDTALSELFTFLGGRKPHEERIRQVLGRKLNAQKEREFSLEDNCDGKLRSRMRQRLMGAATALGYEV